MRKRNTNFTHCVCVCVCILKTSSRKRKNLDKSLRVLKISLSLRTWIDAPKCPRWRWPPQRCVGEGRDSGWQTQAGAGVHCAGDPGVGWECVVQPRIQAASGKVWASPVEGRKFNRDAAKKSMASNLLGQSGELGAE